METKQDIKYFNEVVGCLKEHQIECTPGKVNKKTGTWEEYKIEGKGTKKDFFRHRIGWTGSSKRGQMIMDNALHIKGTEGVTTREMIDSIVDSVTARLGLSNTSENRELIHQLHTVRENNRIDTKVRISFGVVD
jgi:hypothetical protein